MKRSVVVIVIFSLACLLYIPTIFYTAYMAPEQKWDYAEMHNYHPKNVVFRGNYFNGTHWVDSEY